MAATIRDIKNRTGLSLATISKYLNGGNVLPQNKALIEEAIEVLHYEVNELARGLVTNRTRIIGVLVYDIECVFVGKMLHHLGLELHKRGYGMLICDSRNDEKMEVENLQFLMNKKVDGIIVLAVHLNSEFLKPVKEQKLPVVLLDRAFRDEEYDCVKIDNRTAAFRAVNELIRNHHRRIAMIGSDVEYTGVEREKGFMEAMDEAGLPVREEYLRLGKHSFELGYRGMKELLELPEPPTAVFMGNYETTLGGIMAVNESSLTCPEDISLVGFDDLVMTGVLQPKMWIVVQPMKQMCEKAVELLLNRVEKKEEGPALRMSFSARLRKGDSIKKL